MEFGKHDTGGTHPEWAQQLVNDAMNVVERQGVQDDIISGPRPFWNQTLDLRGGPEWVVKMSYCLYNKLPQSAFTATDICYNDLP